MFLGDKPFTAGKPGYFPLNCATFVGKMHFHLQSNAWYWKTLHQYGVLGVERTEWMELHSSNPKKGGTPPTYIASIGIKGERRSKGKQVNLCDYIYKSKSLGNWFIWSIKLCVKTLSKISPMTLEKKLLGLGCFILSFPNMLNPVILKDYSQFKTVASLPSTEYKLTLRSVH